MSNIVRRLYVAIGALTPLSSRRFHHWIGTGPTAVCVSNFPQHILEHAAPCSVQLTKAQINTGQISLLSKSPTLSTIDWAGNRPYDDSY